MTECGNSKVCDPTEILGTIDMTSLSKLVAVIVSNAHDGAFEPAPDWNWFA
jgi:hypothetical protein